MDARILQNVWNDVAAASNAPQDNVRFTIHNALKKHHPDHYLVASDTEDLDFDAFAAAGHASVTIDSSDGFVEHERKFVAAQGGRTTAAQPTLKDKFFFARFTYVWEGKTFLLYRASWKTYWTDKFRSYVLYPKRESVHRAQEINVTSAGVGNNKDDVNCPEIDALFLAVGKFGTLPNKSIWVFEGSYWRQSKSMWASIQGFSWDDVILDLAMKEQMMKDVVNFYDPATQQLYQKYSIPYKRGVLMHGSPGNGKTITIKALVATLIDDKNIAVPALYVKSTKDKCNGDEAAVQRLFAKARTMAPCLLIFEDLDSLVKDEVRSYFLNEVDGPESNDGILMIGSTNHLDKIDSAISSRPSRFDRKYGFDIPAYEQRETYARYWQQKLVKNGVDFPEEICPLVAALTDGFSFAYLKELFIGTLLAMSRGETAEDVDWDLVGTKSAEVSSDGEESVNEDKFGKTENTGEKYRENRDIAIQRKPRQVPLIEVPDHLQKNAFMAIIHRDVRNLTKEMDKADAAESESKNPNSKLERTTNKPACASC